MAFDENRHFWDYVPVMPKSFLLPAKNRKTAGLLHTLDDRDQESVSSGGEDSPDSTTNLSTMSSVCEEQCISPADKVSTLTPSECSTLTPSECSAFNKIDCTPAPFPPPPSTVPASIFPAGLYPSYSFPTWTGDALGTTLSCVSPPFIYPPESLSSSGTEKSATLSPSKNMFYYVDPRIPFTNYFLNLTRLLKKDCSGMVDTSPLSKLGETDMRTNDREMPDSPNEKEGEEELPRDYSKSALHHGTSSAIRADTEESKVKIDTPVTFNLMHNAEPKHFQPPPPPFCDRVLPPPPSILPFTNTLNNSGTLLHPVILQSSGVGFRRFNQEKPPPVKKYKCDVCGKAFSRSNTLVTHKRIHTGDKPFKCEICGRAFRQPGNLTRHRLTHTTVKPYVCPQCNKAFNRASNLHTHMRTHTNYRPFICPYCGKGFHQKIDMKIHCYTHTGRGCPPAAAVGANLTSYD